MQPGFDFYVKRFGWLKLEPEERSRVEKTDSAMRRLNLLGWTREIV